MLHDRLEQDTFAGIARRLRPYGCGGDEGFVEKVGGARRQKEDVVGRLRLEKSLAGPVNSAHPDAGFEPILGKLLRGKSPEGERRMLVLTGHQHLEPIREHHQVAHDGGGFDVLSEMAVGIEFRQRRLQRMRQGRGAEHFNGSAIHIRREAAAARDALHFDQLPRRVSQRSVFGNDQNACCLVLHEKPTPLHIMKRDDASEADGLPQARGRQDAKLKHLRRVGQNRQAFGSLRRARKAETRQPKQQHQPRSRRHRRRGDRTQNWIEVTEWHLRIRPQSAGIANLWIFAF